MASNDKSVRVGAVWSKTAKSGKPYLSISISLAELLKTLGYESPEGLDKEGLDKVSLSAFENTKKTADNQPDYNINYFIPTTQG